MSTKSGFQLRIRDSYGNVVPDIDVSVYLKDTTTAAYIYTTYTATVGTSASPQLTSDSNGYIQFWVDPNNYVEGAAQLFDIDVEDSTVDYTDLDIFKLRASTDGTLAGNSNSVAPTEQAVKTYVDDKDTFNTLTLSAGTTITEFSIDGTLVGNSDNAVPTEKAVKTYVDASANITTFLGLTDTPSSYAASGAIYNVNDTADAVQESGLVLTEGSNTFAITKGTTSLTVEDTSIVNQDLTTDATVTFDTINAFTLGGKLTAGSSEIEGSNFDINGGTIDGTTIATSDITVGAGKTLDVSAGTLTLADNQISGDKVEGGTINAITINTLGLSTGTTINEFSIDGTLAGDSDDAVPTEQAVKTYVDGITWENVTYNNSDTTITLTTADLNSVLIVDNASPVAVNLPSVAAGDIGKLIRIYKEGAGNLTINRADSDVIEDGTSVANTQAAETWANIGLLLGTATKWKFLGAPLGSWSTS